MAVGSVGTFYVISVLGQSIVDMAFRGKFKEAYRKRLQPKPKMIEGIPKASKTSLEYAFLKRLWLESIPKVSNIEKIFYECILKVGFDKD